MVTLQGKKILVVEDFVIIALDIEQMLEDLGCEVVGPASHLDEAMELASKANIDGALLDVNLDGQDIDPVARVLDRRQIPFIFVTGYDTLHISDEFQSRPVIIKPFVVDDVSLKMNEIFGNVPEAVVSCG